jgi:hypothetical protein
MAINKNHEFEELDGIKCSIVERNITLSRASFLKAILEKNGYTVVIAKSLPPKPLKGASTNSATGSSESGTDAQVSELLTLGVTDVTFNPVNAIFGRLLRNHDGKVITLSYWNQQEAEPDENKPYFKNP